MSSAFTRSFASSLILIGASALSIHAFAITARTKAQFIQFVSPGSPYHLVHVIGNITGLTNVQLKDNLTLIGSGAKQSALTAENGSNLLILGKNDQIKHIKLTVQANSGHTAIENTSGRSVGHLTLNQISTNGKILIAVSDQSTDSVISLSNNIVNYGAIEGKSLSFLNEKTPEQAINVKHALLHPAGIALQDSPSIYAAITLAAENGSTVTVNQLAHNTILTWGGANNAVFGLANGTNSQLNYTKSISSNQFHTEDQESYGLLNYATNSGTIHIQAGISKNNIITQKDNAYGIEINADTSGKLTLSKGITGNTIKTEGNFGASAIDIFAYQNGAITLNGGIQNNTINTTGFGDSDMNWGPFGLSITSITGSIESTGGITHNQITTVGNSGNGINLLTTDDLTLTGGIQNNTITTHGILSYGIYLHEAGARFNFSGNIRNNTITTTNSGSTGFFNQVGLAGETKFTGGAITGNTITTENFLAPAVLNYANGGSVLLIGQTFTKNTIKTEKSSDGIINQAEDSGTLINFDIGNSDGVKSFLENNNHITVDANALKVSNQASNGGNIQ